MIETDVCVCECTGWARNNKTLVLTDRDFVLNLILAALLRKLKASGKLKSNLHTQALF